MSFLLDTDTCSIFMRGNSAVFGKFIQHCGRLHVSTITLGELGAWLVRSSRPPKVMEGYTYLRREVVVLDVTEAVAQTYGEVRASQLSAGTRSPQLDLWIACTAITHDLTLVTHNTADFVNVPRLRSTDWVPG